jgi:uncharacterized protein (DUF1697 family)
MPPRWRAIEHALSARFAYTSRVVLLTRAQLARVIQGAPAGFGETADRYRYDVVFLKAPLAATEAVKSVSLGHGVDTAHPGPGVLYFSRLLSRVTQSHLPKMGTLPPLSAHDHPQLEHHHQAARVEDGA